MTSSGKTLFTLPCCPAPRRFIDQLGCRPEATISTTRLSLSKCPARTETLKLRTGAGKTRLPLAWRGGPPPFGRPAAAGQLNGFHWRLTDLDLTVFSNASTFCYTVTMSKVKTFGFDTLSLHAGQQPDPATGARATPIYQTASYVFKSPDHAASLFNVERAGHVYSRITNPTTAVLEERIAALEGGIGAIATASGQAACHLAIATLLGAGEHIVASRSLYGGTHNLLEYTLPRFGITTTFVDPRDPDAFAAAITPQTRLLFGETWATRVLKC